MIAEIPPNNSNKNLLFSILILHFLHLPFRKRKEKTGMISYQFNSLLQESHLLLPVKKDFMPNLSTITPTKLPSPPPNRNSNK